MTEEGWRYPPFIVVERGESLDEWRARIQPDFPTTLQVLSHVTERVRTLHHLGMIHRDLKPANVLWRPQEHCWTLIDFGCAALIGAHCCVYGCRIHWPSPGVRGLRCMHVPHACMHACMHVFIH
ncbi:MAG: phosphotransferase [Akkermansiaceae bacterium]|nr:phosphotransferase [Akkermansiaceae bacterium]